MSRQLNLFRRLLRVLFPEDFRAGYEAEITRTFEAQRRAAKTQGPHAVARLWWETLSDVMRTAPQQHAAQFRQDLRYALRMMRRTPGFTSVAVLTLAVGIGANTAIFSVFNAVFLKPLPYTNPASIAMLWNHWAGTDRATLSIPELLDFRERLRSVDVGAFGIGSSILVGRGDPVQLRTAAVTANLLEVLGVQPVIGRTFRPEEERRGNDRVAILSHQSWEQIFEGDAAVVGRTVTLDRLPHTVIGVLPRDFVMPHDFAAEDRTAVLTPFAMDPAEPRHERGGHYLQSVVRVRDGFTFDDARAEVRRVAAGFMDEYRGEYDTGYGATLTRVERDILRNVRVAIPVLLGAVGLVLLIACANVANLLLARANVRWREIAVRKALGASRARLVRQVMTESAALAAAAAASGIILAHVMTSTIVGLASGVPRIDLVRLDTSVLAFALALAVGTAFVFGGVPATDLARRDVNATALVERTRTSGRRNGLRGVLVGTQVALAIVLLVGAGLLVQSFSRLTGTPAGVNRDHVITFRVALPTEGYDVRDRVVSFYGELTERLRMTSGVRAAGAVMNLPLDSPIGDWDFYLPGEVPGPHGSDRPADWQVVTPGYLEAMGVPLIRGRFPTVADHARAPAVVIVNDVLARTYFGNRDALGQQIRMSGGDRPWMTIVGICGTVRHNGLDVLPAAQVYIPHAQFTPFWNDSTLRALTVVARTERDPLSVMPFARALVRELDPTVPLSHVMTMERVFDRAVAPRRLNMLLLACFGTMALLLATVGTYSVLAYQVTERTREFGVRMALGARTGDIVRMVMAQGMAPAVLGVVVGLVGAGLLTRLLASLLFETKPLDIPTFAVTTSVLLMSALAACVAPARRATHVDPGRALRAE